ncbi:MAG: alpha/beta hydrolase [Alphaproteobacteria bacterium]|nr:alpha/beta hydrolase [Alphaproteobacteria bacterium]
MITPLSKKHFYRRFGGWILTLALIYAVFIASIGLMQRHLLYFPSGGRFVPQEWGAKELQPLQVTTEDGLKITSWYSPARARDKLTVVFFQGNSGQLGTRVYKVRPWLDAGYGVLMIGYRGFDGNPGAPSEEGLYRDSQAAIDAIIAQGAPECGLVFYGESLGTGVAAQMATEYDAAGLILEAPYTSIADVGAHQYPLVPVNWLLRDRFDTLGKIKEVHAPLLLLHGEKDQVVPINFGKELFAAAGEPKQAVFLPDAGHNNVYNLKVQEIVLSFLSKLPTDPLLNKCNAKQP